MAKHLKKSGQVDNSGKQRNSVQEAKESAMHHRSTPVGAGGSDPGSNPQHSPGEEGSGTSEAALKDLIRTIVREELSRMQADQSAAGTQNIDRIAEDIFTKYDDVFKALA